MKQSMSLVVAYFGFRKTDDPLPIKHHSILLGPRYEGLLTDIFDRKVLTQDFSQYLHVPTLTDPSLAPEGYHTAYTLAPVAHNGSGIDWNEHGERFVQAMIEDIERRGFIPNLRERITHLTWVTPDYFEHTLDSHMGNAFGVEPTLTQSAWFRPHNRSEDVENLYMVGASAQPGAGTPSVMMSAKMTARVILEDHGVGLLSSASRVATHA
jgi:phytoene desaturase